MAIVRWQPVRTRSAFDRLFDDIETHWLSPKTNGNGNGHGHALALDVREDDNSYVVSAAVPGVNSDAIDVKVENDVLTIAAEVNEVHSEEDKHTLLKERRYGKFSRSLRFPENVDSDAIEATYENGVLTLTLPKVPEAQPRTIPVKVS
jgi:HSP20 family protein